MGCSRGRLNRSFVTGTCLHLPSYASIISRLLISLRAPVRGSAGQPVRRPPSPPVHRSACPSMSVAGPHPPRAGLPRCLGCPPGGRGSPTSAEPRRAWGRPRGGSGGWGGGGTLPGPILGTQPAICRNPVSLLTREPPNTPQFLQIEAQRLLGPLRGTFLSVIWTPAERLARRRAEC